MDRNELRKEADRLLASADVPDGLDSAGLTLKTLYESLRTGGFSMFQALWLVGYVLTGGSTTGFNEEDDNAS